MHVRAANWAAAAPLLSRLGGVGGGGGVGVGGRAGQGGGKRVGGLRRLHLELARAKENEASLLHSHIARICHCPFFLYTSPDVLYLHGRFVHDLTSRAVTRTRRARTRRRATAIAPCGCCSSPRTRRRLGGHSSSRGRGGQKSLTPTFPPPICHTSHHEPVLLFACFRMVSHVFACLVHRCGEEGAVLCAAYCHRRGDAKGAVEFFLLGGRSEDAFKVATETGQVGYTIPC